ncbi:gustatory receptor [Homalodisca vitripennis]|nr:gustatory receptor [Homalodisca vitripennis]
MRKGWGFASLVRPGVPVIFSEKHFEKSDMRCIFQYQKTEDTDEHLLDAVHQANVFYGDQLMAIIFSAFIHITIKFYFLFLNVTTGKVLLTISEVAWILTYICFLVVLVNCSSDVTNSADETGQMICKLINKDLDPILSKKLEGFLLQLPHHNARFSALGFFQIHNETLTGMAGAVTTYLVILIQFQVPPTST